MDPVETLEEFKRDAAELVGQTPEQTEPEKTPEPEPAPEPAKEPEAKAEEKPEEPEPETWSKPLQKLQQKNAALEKEVSQLREAEARRAKEQERRDREWRQLMAINGIEPEPETEPEKTEAPPAKPADASTPEEELRMETSAARREREFLKIERKHPDFDCDANWDAAVNEVLELHGIPKDSEELPKGLTFAALETAARKMFDRKLAEHAKKPEPPKKPTAPRLPPKTPGGAGAVRTGSHVPAPAPANSEGYDFKTECARLVGQAE